MKIFILESLKQTDPKTGKQVFDYLKSKSIDVEFYNFHSKQELLNILDIIKLRSASESFQPFVHFDCHGNNDGIGAISKDGTSELIKWKSIRDEFRAIYMSSKRRSIICMSSCEGFNAIKLVAQCEPCPYDHVCGSFEKISFDDSYNAYTKFYDLVYNGKSIYEASVEIHNTAEFKNMKFMGINSETLFKMAIDGYLKNECTEEKLQSKKDKYEKLLSSFGPLTEVQKDYLNKAYSIEGQKVIVERCAETFFSLK